MPFKFTTLSMGLSYSKMGFMQGKYTGNAYQVLVWNEPVDLWLIKDRKEGWVLKSKRKVINIGSARLKTLAAKLNAAQEMGNIMLQVLEDEFDG